MPEEAGCELPSGVRFSVTQDGVLLTNPNNPGDAFPFVSVDGVFIIQVEIGSTIVITEDVTTIGGTGSIAAFQVMAELFVPKQNPITIQSVAPEQEGVVFINLLLQVNPSPSASPAPSGGPSTSPAPSTGPPAPSTVPSASPGTGSNLPPITRFPSTGVGVIDAAGGVPMLAVIALGSVIALGLIGSRKRRRT